MGISKKNGEGRSSKRLKEKAKVNYNDEENDETTDDDILQKDQVAALAADLPPFDMSELEKQALPAFVDAQEVYVSTRNHILTLWQDDLHKFITVEAAEKSIQTKYRPFVSPAHQFLSRYGFINTGVVKHAVPEKPDRQYKVVVIGAGMSGLAAARQLHHLGYQVTLLEGRNRVGGRVNTDRSLGEGVDLGASIVTGLEGNPLTTVCKQLETKLHPLTYECPIYDIDGVHVDKETDKQVEGLFNTVLQQCAEEREELEESLGASIDILRKKNGEEWSEEEKKKRDRLFDWHVANLEYGCAIDLHKVSRKNWDQDDSYDWAGDHCLLRQGYGSIADRLHDGLDLRLNTSVSMVTYNTGDAKDHSAIVTTSSGDIQCDAVLCTVSLGVLKSKSIQFSPPLPEWKQKSIDNLGFGLLNKVVLLFPEVFWNDELDYFGQTADEGRHRGEFYLYWNLHRCMGRPVLIALMAGEAAYASETRSEEEIVSRVMTSLGKLFGREIPRPTRSIVTRWGSDPFAMGSYSYIAVNSSGDDYDSLARKVDENLFFAGEATTRTHPATAAGAYLSGLRTAGDICRKFQGEIVVDFDVQTLYKEWTSEHVKTPQKKNQQKRLRAKINAERKGTRRGRRGFKMKKAKFNPSYSWLFSSVYKIPKRVEGQINDASTSLSSLPSSSVDRNSGLSQNGIKKEEKFGDYYNPNQCNKRALDFLPARARAAAAAATIPTTPSSEFSQQLSPSTTRPYYSPSPAKRQQISVERSPHERNYRDRPHNDYIYVQNREQRSYYNQPPRQERHPTLQQRQPTSDPTPTTLTEDVKKTELNVSQEIKLPRETKDLLSSAVVSSLSKTVAKHGKQMQKEDFKHLARKLTHICGSKEMKRSAGEEKMGEEEREQMKQRVNKLVVDYVKKMKEDKKPPFN
ncbi:Lysine-specific histone demethylase 1-2 [Planoprotostelium fungivorum]|uniref:Lysine-specific histone demethylase 1-2 n=1 Tax=Planoprotostelium fungivorum TaxID=1890364 RepID=A0A2P6N623_9EUKA|nr:Lysine-specific histone demethylase 1-2 [Planoprotostelium fungivorum]